MSKVIEQWPPEADPHGPLVAGEDVELILRWPTDQTGWQWAGTVRDDPDGPVVARFTATAHPDVANAWVLRCPAADSVNLRTGQRLDLRTTAPVRRTWVTITRLWVIEPVSD